MTHSISYDITYGERGYHTGEVLGNIPNASTCSHDKKHDIPNRCLRPPVAISAPFNPFREILCHVLVRGSGAAIIITRICLPVNSCVYIYIYIHMFVCVYIYIYMYIHMLLCRRTIRHPRPLDLVVAAELAEVGHRVALRPQDGILSLSLSISLSLYIYICTYITIISIITIAYIIT